jgi:phytoene dehydrogenase-like protein
MSHLDLDNGVLYPRGGFARVVEAVRALAEAEGARIMTGAAVAGILTEPAADGRHRVCGVRYREPDGTVRTLAAGTIVSAADLHHTETALLPRPLQTYQGPGRC